LVKNSLGRDSQSKTIQYAFLTFQNIYRGKNYHLNISDKDIDDEVVDGDDYNDNAVWRIRLPTCS